MQQFFQLFCVFFGCFSLAFVCGSLSFVQKYTNAESDIDAVADGTALLNIYADASDLAFDISPSSTAPQNSGEATIYVSTNNATGYSLTMNSETGNLTHSTMKIYTINSTRSESAGALPANSWGYNKDSSETSFMRVPTAKASDTLTAKQLPAEVDPTTITVAARADTSLLVGSYTGVLTFTAVANYAP